ncbi:MAG: hypothetical protein C0605_05090, partial [Hyphomicrobiales bacterium]
IVLVTTKVAEMRGARFMLDQSISRDGETLFTARVTAALLSLQGRPQRIPAGMKAKIDRLIL